MYNVQPLYAMNEAYLYFKNGMNIRSDVNSTKLLLLELAHICWFRLRFVNLLIFTYQPSEREYICFCWATFSVRNKTKSFILAILKCVSIETALRCVVCIIWFVGNSILVSKVHVWCYFATKHKCNNHYVQRSLSFEWVFI